LAARPGPAGGAYSAPPELLAGCEGPTSKGEEMRVEGVDRRGGEWRNEWGREMCVIGLRGMDASVYA